MTRQPSRSAAQRSESGDDDRVADWLAAVAGGDEAAFETLYEATSRWVLAVARSVLGDHHDAEEVVVDVYRQVWEQAARFSSRRGSGTTWLLVLTRSRAVDRLRAASLRRGRERPLETGVEPRRETAHDAALLAGERNRRLAAALGELPREQRDSIELAFLGGLSHSQIASRTGEPLGTVKTRIRRGMLRLRGLLDQPENAA